MKYREDVAYFRKEKWIQKIFRIRSCTGKEDRGKPHIYILFNHITKRCYIGQTKNGQKIRLQGHFHQSSIYKFRPVYKYIRKIGWENWIIAPLEFCELEHLDEKERKWIHLFRGNVVNDPQMWIRKPIERTEKKQVSERDWKRIENVRAARLEYQNKTRMIINGEEWKSWDYKTKLSLLVRLKNVKIDGHTLNRVKRRVINDLREKKFDIQYCYKINLLWAPEIKLLEIKKWIEQQIRNHITDEPLREYIISTLSISTSRENTIQRLIENRKRTLKETKAQCNCKNWLIDKNSDGHVHLKVEELSESHKELRKMLTLNKKCTVTMNYRDYIGAQLGLLQTKLRKLLKQGIIIKDKKVVNLLSKQDEGVISYRTVKKVWGKYSNDFVVLERDKNINTWTLTCKKYYQDIVDGYFSTDSHYKRLESNEESVKKSIEKQVKNIAWIKKTSKKWNIGYAYLIPKDKDINKWRPIVSYSKFHTRQTGKLISRGLSVIIKEVGKYWKQLNLHTTRDFIKEIDIINNSEKWKERIKNGITFVKTDQKNQFTELNKNSVKSALQEVLKTLKKKESSIISLAKLKNFKYRDHLGSCKNRDFLLISFRQIMEYANFEMENTIFVVRGKVYEQINGLPMGGFLSAGLACIYSMYCESVCERFWRHGNLVMKAWRFRDDTIAIINGKIQKTEIEKYRRMWELIYGPGIEVTLEDWNEQEINFLDYKINTLNNKLSLILQNKNIERKGKLVRFVPEGDACSKYIKRGIIIGVMKKCIECGNSCGNRITAILSHAIEFIELGYSVSDIRNALFKLGGNKTALICARILLKLSSAEESNKVKDLGGSL